MKNISNHITYYEATKSGTATRYGLDNTPNAEQLDNMYLVADKIFEPTRLYIDDKIQVASFFRAPKVNLLVGSTNRSDHPKGKAIDMDGDMYGVDNKLIFDFIRDNCEFDQLLWEYGSALRPNWVHASYRKGANRMKVLQVLRVNGKTKFVPFNLY